MYKKESFLITGAAGFIGACLAHRLVQEGAKVSVIVKKDSNLWRLSAIKGQLHIYRGDLTDKKFLRTAVHKIKPMVIYHLATHGAYSRQDDAEEIITTNILGTWNLLNATTDIDYKVFVNTGSSSEYGFKSSPMRETDLLEPNSYYAVAKSAQTLLNSYYARFKEKPNCTFRLFSVYGYFEEPSRLVPTLVNSCLKRRALNMVSPQTARDFIFIDDVIDAYLSLNKLSRLRGEILNIGTGRQVSLKKIVDEALRLTKAKVAVHWGKMPERIWDTNIWVADTRKSQRILGWKAKTTLSEGLHKTIAWFQQEGSKYRKVYR